MIAFVKGPVAHVNDHEAVIDCNGIGYRILINPTTASSLRHGEQTSLYTHMSVKEDDVSLYGFVTREEINIFKQLIGVSGIGAKTALGILSVMSPVQLMMAIISDDTDGLSKAPGIGKKTAQRIVLELKDKMKKSKEFLTTSDESQLRRIEGLGTGLSSERQDAADALIALGYGRSDAMKAVCEVAADGMKTEQIIRLSLRLLNRTV